MISFRLACCPRGTFHLAPPCLLEGTIMVFQPPPWLIVAAMIWSWGLNSKAFTHEPMFDVVSFLLIVSRTDHMHHVGITRRSPITNHTVVSCCFYVYISMCFYAFRRQCFWVNEVSRKSNRCLPGRVASNPFGRKSHCPVGWEARSSGNKHGNAMKLSWAEIVDQLLVELDLGFLKFEIRQRLF